MDYRGIYEKFIDSRRAREEETAAREYTERHHIVPRCQGGDDDEDNINRLTYREHIFAHALLLKGARSEEEAWYLAASMSAVLNFDAAVDRNRALAGRSLAWARRLHGASIRGTAHPGYKHDEHTFYGVDGRVVRGTRQELITETGLPFRVVYDNGHREHAQGWCSTEEEALAYRDSEQARLTRHERCDHRFYNVDGRNIIKDRYTMNAAGVDRNVRTKIAQTGHANGWCQDPEEAVLRAEGRWRQAPKKRRKFAGEFVFSFNEPISLEDNQLRRTTMTRQERDFIEFVLRNSVERKTDDCQHTILASANGDNDYAWATAEDWVKAHKLWFAVLEYARLPFAAKRHAKLVLKETRKHSALRDKELMDLCQRHTTPHGNTSTKVFTLFSNTGEAATGNIIELRDETGLPHERVRDLTSGRRRYVKGWAISEEEARKGPAKPTGRPRRAPDKAPEPEFFEAASASFF